MVHTHWRLHLKPGYFNCIETVYFTHFEQIMPQRYFWLSFSFFFALNGIGPVAFCVENVYNQIVHVI